MDIGSLLERKPSTTERPRVSKSNIHCSVPCHSHDLKKCILSASVIVTVMTYTLFSIFAPNALQPLPPSNCLTQAYLSSLKMEAYSQWPAEAGTQSAHHVTHLEQLWKAKPTQELSTEDSIATALLNFSPLCLILPPRFLRGVNPQRCRYPSASNPPNASASVPEPSLGVECLLFRILRLGNSTAAVTVMGSRNDSPHWA